MRGVYAAGPTRGAFVDSAACLSQEMSPQYDPATVEPRWASEWIDRGYFEAHLPSDREPYCIVIPPPNVTGRAARRSRAFGTRFHDMLIRRARMQGYETLWLPGMDHAGIATQVVVERELRKEGIDRRDIGREAFVERVWAWKEQYGGEIVDQIKRMGCSLDWSRQRFTMDEGLSQGGPGGVRPLVRRGPDLSRRATGQLVPDRPDRPVGFRGGARGRRGRAGHVPLPLVGRQRFDRLRDHARRDDARRHGDRGASRTTNGTHP